MQRQRGWFEPFPEAVDLNQGSVADNSGMDQPNAWNTMLNPVETRLSNYARSSSEANHSCPNASGHSARNYGGWDVGESSSSVNAQELSGSDDLKMEHNYFRLGPDTNLDERQTESSNSFLPNVFDSSLEANHVTRGPFSMQSAVPSNTPMSVNLSSGYVGGRGVVETEFPNFHKSRGPEMETSASSAGVGTSSGNSGYFLHTSGGPEMETSASSAGVGTSSGNSGYFLENDGGSDSPFGAWGLSCKRKSVEGTPAQTFAGGSSSCFPQSEITFRPTIPARTNPSSSLTISNPHRGSRQELMNPRPGVVGIRGAVSDNAFPPSNVPGSAENSQRHFGVGLNPGHQESSRFNISSSSNHGRISSRAVALNDFLDSTPTASQSTNSTNLSHQTHLMHVPGLPRNMLPFPWSGPVNSRVGSSSSSSARPGERGAESSFRSTLRNANMDHPNVVPTPDARNLMQDPTSWSLGNGNSSASGGVPSSSRNNLGPTSSSRSFPSVWVPHHNNATQSQQRVSEFSPWTLFPSPEPDTGGQRRQVTPFPSGSSSSSEETVIPSGVNRQGHHQTFPRSGLLMEVPGDNWRALAADMEGRQRLVSEIRQVLDAMRRGENLRAEDYMVFDPFINGVAEMHDRHRDMRLDVDNMSYEELLALEDRIGNVNTGLSEETIIKTMKQRNHISYKLLPPAILEPCCVCQEEYVTGDAIGTLDCGHDFHTDCIKQWLTQKNLCPICKMTGLNT